MENRLAFANTGYDLEAGPNLESMMPGLRCSCTSKMFILAIQLLSIVVGAVVGSNDPIVTFLTTTTGGFACYIVITIITPFFTFCALCYYRNCLRVKYVIFGIFTVSLSFGIGLTCAFTSVKLIAEVTALTTLLIVSLALFAPWATKRGYRFNFLGPFLFGAIMVLLIYVIIQIFFHIHKAGIPVSFGSFLPATIFDLMERIGSHLTVELATVLIANSPLKSKDQFTMNWSMTNVGKPIPEVHIIIKVDDKNIPPKPSQELKGKKENRKPKTKTKGKGIAKNKKKQVKDLTCFHCGQLGHLRKQCQSYLEDFKGKAGQTSTQGAKSKYIM